MRKCKDWLDSYVEFHTDNFVPEKFLRWTAISVLAAALERKVWLRTSKNNVVYPNFFILLVSGPGIGKSSAINPGVGMLRDLKPLGKRINILPSQITEAKLIDMLAKPENATFEWQGQLMKQTAYYYFASEASASLRDIFGGFINVLTELYDCNPVFSRGTKGDGPKPLEIHNACLNMLAGSTFDYLGKLVTDDSIMGGFASRITYVVQKEQVERQFVFGAEGSQEASAQKRENLLRDLKHISELVGGFRVTPAYIKVWEDWKNKQHIRVQRCKNEKMQALLTRQHVMMDKLSMIMCAARTSDMKLDLCDWERALKLLQEVEQYLPDMLRASRARDVNSQAGLTNFLLKHLKEHNNVISATELMSDAVAIGGFQRESVRSTVESFISGGILEVEAGTLKLIGDANRYI